MADRSTAKFLDAFAEELDRLNYGPFRLWWKRMVAELRHTDPKRSSRHRFCPRRGSCRGRFDVRGKARAPERVVVFQSKDFDRDPKTWKIDDLVSSAATGSASAILDLQTKNRAETLIRTRQRIHAGRMLSDFPGGPPDIRPEEAHDAKATAEQVVRAILDWLQRFPPAP